ncbi:MAG: AbrB/MazE/SpoVT family DNA-binding domain-containing protein [Candidatus Aenigmarchaeota archaeon]|nr:AbrB/MazE/SpoVT family DNA-binding domain-containing protein [Candidatus Aenigmarchaeota archaeon]
MEVEITKMTSRGQVVIPQDIREKEGLEEGEKFVVIDINGTILLKRIKNLNTKTLDNFEETFKSLWETAKTSGISERGVEREIQDYRKS